MAFSFADDTGFLNDLQGAGGYIEQNTDVPYEPLAGDLGLDDGVTIPTEAEAGAIQTEDGFTMDYVAGTEAGATGSNFAVERMYDQPMGPDKLRSNIKGKMKNANNTEWRTRDNTGKWFKPKQKFKVSDAEFGEILDEPFDFSDEDIIDDAVDALDEPEPAEPLDPKGRTMEQGNSSARFNRLLEENQDVLQREAAARVFADKFEDQPMLSDESFRNMYGELDELNEMPESMLDTAAKYYRRMVNHIGRKFTGNKSGQYIDADTARIEMQNMGSNNLHQALLDGYEEHAGAPMLGDDDYKAEEAEPDGDLEEKRAEVPEPEDTPGAYTDAEADEEFEQLWMEEDFPDEVPEPVWGANSGHEFSQEPSGGRMTTSADQSIELTEIQGVPEFTQNRSLANIDWEDPNLPPNYQLMRHYDDFMADVRGDIPQYAAEVGDVLELGAAAEAAFGAPMIGPQYVPSDWKKYTQPYIDRQARNQQMLDLQKSMREQFDDQDVWFYQDGAWYKGKVTRLDNVSYNNDEAQVEIEYEYSEKNKRKTDRVTVPAMSSAVRVAKDWGAPGDDVRIGTWKPGTDPYSVDEMAAEELAEGNQILVGDEWKTVRSTASYLDRGRETRVYFEDGTDTYFLDRARFKWRQQAAPTPDLDQTEDMTEDPDRPRFQEWNDEHQVGNTSLGYEDWLRNEGNPAAPAEPAETWGTDPAQQSIWNPLTGEYEDPAKPAADDFFGSHTDPPPKQQTDHFGSHSDFSLETDYVQYSQRTIDAMAQLEAESGVPQAVKTV